MTDKDYRIFELMLIRKYESKPSPDLSEVLIKEFSAHKIKNTEPTEALNKWILDRSKKVKNRIHDISTIFELKGYGSRPATELTYIPMNALCWRSILQNKNLKDSFAIVSKLFNESVETVEIGFYRKNHDFGERELCRFGLDLCLAILGESLTNEQKSTIASILKESVETQMIKDQTHHRSRYKI